jgi:ABC-type nitrate/sulfonate/bicarbonate transport system substrate-binding protein
MREHVWGSPSRSRFLAGAGAVAIAAAHVRPAGAQALRDISLGLISPTAAMWPTFIAQELDLYRRNRLNPDFIFVGSVAAAAQQLAAGSLDVGEISSTQIVEAVQGGAALRYICEEVVNPPYTFLAQKQYKHYADLKGKLVIIGGVNDITVIFTQKMFASGGLKYSDVDFTYAGGTADRYAALKSGSVAAAILAPPFSFRAAEEGYTVLGTLKQVLSSFPFVGWAATDAYARGHDEVLVDFVKSQLRATRWLNDPANKAKAIDILARRANASADDASKSYDELIVRDKSFPDTGDTSRKTFATVVDALAQLKVLTPPLPAPTNFFDNRYVDRAAAQLAHEPK